MDMKARCQSAASGQGITGAQAPALDVCGQRARDLQKRWKDRASVERRQPG